MGDFFDDFDVEHVPGTSWKGSAYTIQSTVYRHRVIKIIVNVKEGVVGWIFKKGEKYYGSWFDLERVDRRHVNAGMVMARVQAQNTVNKLFEVTVD